MTGTLRNGFLFLLFFGSTSAFAVEQKFRGLSLSADRSERILSEERLKLSGNVVIQWKDQELRAEEASIQVRGQTIEATGNVVLKAPNVQIEASHIIVDFETQSAVIRDGFVQAGPFSVQGRELTRNGENEYFASDAKVTACQNCPETWSFRGEKLRAELGGYAFLKNSVFRVGGWSIFYMPYLVLPMKSERQSGLLAPEFEFSKLSGATVEQSLFLALNRSHDVTLTVKNYELRGTKFLGNYRFVLSEESSGEADFGVLRDRVFATDGRLNAFRSQANQGEPIQRWFLKYNHLFHLPNQYIHRLTLNNASDLQYPKDFPLETRNHGESAMENRMSLTRNGDAHHFMVDLGYSVNLMQADPLAGNNEAVHRLPEVHLEKVARPLGDSQILTSYRFNFVQFLRNDFAYDDLNRGYQPDGRARTLLPQGPAACDDPLWYNNPECARRRDGVFDPTTDLIRTGQRFDAEWGLSRPTNLGDVFTITPSLGLRQTSYRFQVGDDPANDRRLLRLGVVLSSQFHRVFGDTRNLKHEVEPEVGFTTVPWYDHPRHPFFGSVDSESQVFSGPISDDDLNSPFGLQFDYNDRVTDRKMASIGFNQRWIQKRFIDGRSQYRQIVAWKIKQSYDFLRAENPQEDVGPQPLSDLQSDLKVSLDQVDIFSKANYYPYQQVTDTSTRIRLRDKEGDYIEAAHLVTFPRSVVVGATRGTRNEFVKLTFKKRILQNTQFWGQLNLDLNPSEENRQSPWGRLRSYGFVTQFFLPGQCLTILLQHYRVTDGDNPTRIALQFPWDAAGQTSAGEKFLDQYAF